MLAAHSFDNQPHDIYFDYPGTLESAVPVLNPFNIVTSRHDQPQDIMARVQTWNLNEVTEALEIARESPDGAGDPSINNVLETYLCQVWRKVLAQPDTYVMSREEFAVFNFFQHRFEGNKVAITARKRYWDNITGSSSVPLTGINGGH
ncbi:hypothetical protein F4775DRAFT_569640 [Biscogniauxia sp. FL1348]|nr:hypothetical protein F4775DRAFT_569640 [Biscogniauxia sp. FL1348]